jgi:hypothetical protein
MGGPVKEMAHVTNVNHLTRLLAGLDEYDRAFAHASPSR